MKKLKVLVIDDCTMVPIWQRTIELMGVGSNAKAVQCHGLMEALTAIEEYQPDHLLLDHSLTPGGKEGLTIAEGYNHEISITSIGDPNFRGEYLKLSIGQIPKSEVMSKIRQIIGVV